MNFTTLALIVALFFSSDMARAAESNPLCDFYKKAMPDLYKIACGSNPRKSRAAGANSTFADSFNVNPASLPNEPSSYGLETIGSYLRSDTRLWQPSFALIKGFKKIGTGVSTAGNNTFYGNDIVQREFGPSNLSTFRPNETPIGKFADFNAGVSFTLIETKKKFKTILGVSGRYNNMTATFGGGAGVILTWQYLTFGTGWTREKVSNKIEPVMFFSNMISAKLGFIELEYQFLDNRGGYSLDPIHIGTLTVSFGRTFISGAVRRATYVSEGTVYQKHAAIQYLLSKHVSLGYLYNYIPGANSLAIQLFL